MSEQTMEFTRKPEYVLHPDGEWRAIFVSWEPDTHPEYGQQVKFTFETEVVDDEGKKRKMSAWGKPNLHPNGKPAKMLTAMGVDIDAFTDEQLKAFSFDQHLGKKLRLSIAHEPKKSDPTVKVDKITGFLPFKKDAVRTAPEFDEPEAPAAPAPAAEPAKPKATKPQPPTAPAAPAAPEPNWEEE